MRWFNVMVMSFLLVACNSEDVETANFGSNFYKNEYLITNLTNESVTIYSANTEMDGDERNSFQSKYLRESDLYHGNMLQLVHEHNTKKRVIFGIDALEMSRLQQVHRVNNETDYHLILWQKLGKFKQTLLVKRPKNTGHNMTLRVLSISDELDIRLANSSFLVNPGVVSGQYEIENCKGEIWVNDIELDVCEADYGKSYLLVLKGKTKFLIPEHDFYIQ